MEDQGDFAAFAAPPTDESNVGDVYYGNNDEQSNEFFNPPPSTSEAPIVLEPSFVPPGVENVEEEDGAELPDESALIPAESSPMAKFNEEWQQTLLARKDEENAAKSAAVQKAQDEIAAFQTEREKRRESRMAKNRSDEQEKLEAIEADLENDNSWQKVVKMIELNQDSKEGSVDTGRMRDILVLMKNEPGRAEALTAWMNLTFLWGRGTSSNFAKVVYFHTLLLWSYLNLEFLFGDVSTTHEW